jgi:hypothetical protein
MRNRIVVTIVALALSMPGVALAHSGHLHKLLGTVTSIDYPHMDVVTTDKKTTVTIMFDASSKVTRGKAKVEDTEIKVGDRVSVEYEEKGGMMMVKTLKLGVVAAKGAK